jgi:hypothetical protein|tara:strand:- start:104 stop:250 length:147 start_codon:yes stop_codon:yes gene_type:complete
MSFDEYKEQFLRDLDEVSILEVLDISGEDLLNAFEDRLLRYREDNDEY